MVPGHDHSHIVTHSSLSTPFLHAAATAERPPFQWQNFPYELAALVFIVLYVVNLFIGRARNAAIALQWHDATRDLFASQFSALSAFADGSGAGATFLKDSHSCFKFYASGRRHCAGMLATLELRARQCLFASALALLDPSSARDAVTLEFPLDELEPLVLCLARKRDEARLRRALPDLDLYVTSKAGATSKALTAALAAGAGKQGSASASASATTLPFAHTLMVDAGGAELDGGALLDERVCAALIKHAELFAFVHVSDQHIPDLQNFGGGSAAAATDATAAASMSPPRKMLRVKMYLPADLSAASSAASGLLKLTEMALYLLDRVATVQLPLPALNRAREARAAVAKRHQKTPAQLQAEAAARRREEKRAKEAELVAQMTPEQLRRHEEREAKERAKRTQHKVRVLR